MDFVEIMSTFGFGGVIAFICYHFLTKTDGVLEKNTQAITELVTLVKVLADKILAEKDEDKEGEKEG